MKLSANVKFRKPIRIGYLEVLLHLESKYLYKKQITQRTSPLSFSATQITSTSGRLGSQKENPEQILSCEDASMASAVSGADKLMGISSSKIQTSYVFMFSPNIPQEQEH